MKEAKTWAEVREIEIQNRGLAAASIPEALRIEAIEMKALVDREAPGKSITDAVRYALTRWKAASASLSVEKAVFAFLSKKLGIAESVIRNGKRGRAPGDEDRPGYSERYRDDVRLRLAGFVADFGTRVISEIEKPEVSNWLEAWPNSACDQNNTRRVLSVLWSYAEEKGWVGDKFIEKIKPAQEDGGEIGVLTPAEAARFLHRAPDRIKPRLAIGLFAGTRRSELLRVRTADIKSTIGPLAAQSPDGYLWVRVSKCGPSQRNVRIRPVLAAWLRDYPIHEMTVNEYRGDFDRARNLAQIEEWPHNAMRHSFCSYAYEAEQNITGLAMEMGHRDTSMIHVNYRNVVSPEDAVEFWRLTPERCLEIAKSI